MLWCGVLVSRACAVTIAPLRAAIGGPSLPPSPHTSSDNVRCVVRPRSRALRVVRVSRWERGAARVDSVGGLRGRRARAPLPCRPRPSCEIARKVGALEVGADEWRVRWRVACGVWRCRAGRWCDV